MTHATARAYAYQPPPWPLPHHHAARPWCSAAACRWRSSPPSTAWAKPGGTPEHPHSANAAEASPPQSPRAAATLGWGGSKTALDSQYWRRAAAAAVAAASGKGQGVARGEAHAHSRPSTAAAAAHSNTRLCTPPGGRPPWKPPPTVRFVWFPGLGRVWFLYGLCMFFPDVWLENHT